MSGVSEAARTRHQLRRLREVTTSAEDLAEPQGEEADLQDLQEEEAAPEAAQAIQELACPRGPCRMCPSEKTLPR